MKINMKRLLSMLMALCMVIGMVPSLALNTSATVVEPVDIRAQIAINKVVEVQGAGEAPDATFEFEVYTLSEFDNDVATIGRRITPISIETTGAGTYAESVGLGAEDVVDSVYNLIVEKNTGEENWNYHPETLGYVVEFYNNGNYGSFRIHAAYIEGDEVTLLQTVSDVIFTNTYYVPETTFLNLPFTKTVELVGSGEVPEVDFEFTLNELTDIEFKDGKPFEAVMGDEVDSTTVATIGAGAYEGSFTLESEDLLNGWYVLSEVEGSEEFWYYSNFAYVVSIEYIQINDLDAAESTSYDIHYYPAIKYGDEISIFGEHEVNADSMEFVNEYYAPAAVRIEVPFTKTVELGGNTEPGETEFQLEMIPYGDYDFVIENDTIVTDGEGNYEGVFSFLIGEEDLDMLSEGFVLKEVAVEDDKWECDTTPWLVVAYPQEVNSLEDRDVTEISMNIVTYEAELVEVDNLSEYIPVDNTPDDIVFVNTYTENVEAPEYEVEEDDYSVIVKVKFDGVDEDEIDKVRAILVKNGKNYKTKPVSEKIDWEYEWTGLNDVHKWTVDAEEIEGYDMEIKNVRANYWVITISKPVVEKANPETGASDFVGAAVALAACSAVCGAALMLKRK